MTAFYVILAAFPVLLLGAVTFLVTVAVGVRKGDRADLMPTARNRLDSITRRVLGVSVRSSASREE